MVYQDFPQDKRGSLLPRPCSCYGNTGGEGQDAQEDGPAGSNPPEDTPQADGDTVTDTAAPSGGAAALSIAGCVGGIAALVAAAYWGFEKIKERRSAT